MIVEGADAAAAAMRRSAATIDLRMLADMEAAASRIEQQYRSDIGRYSGRTAAGVDSEVRMTPSGVEAEVFNTHVNAGLHEYGGARSAPNPAMKRAVDANVPSWVDRVEQRRREL